MKSAGIDTESLFSSYAGLVHWLARKASVRIQSGGEVELGDLVNAGVVGLLEAAGRFDPEIGSDFASFARMRIEGAMFDVMRRCDWTPRSVYESMRDIEAAKERLRGLLGREPAAKEVADYLGMDLDRYYRVVGDFASTRLCRLDDLTDSGWQLETMEPYVETSEGRRQDLVDEVNNDKVRECFYREVGNLPRAEFDAVTLYSTGKLRMKDIGALMGCSESRVSQLVSSAVSQLRR